MPGGPVGPEGLEGPEGLGEPESPKAAGSSDAAGDAPRPAGWWSPAALGCALALLLVAAFPPWPDSLVEDVGGTPWWVAAPALGAGLLLTLGVGTRRSAAWALLPLASASGLGTLAFFTASGSGDDARPAAPLAAALACGLAMVFCLPLVRRRRPWLGHARAPEPLRRRARALTVFALVGALVGGLLGAAAGLGAGGIREATAEEEEPPFSATSEPLSADVERFTAKLDVGSYAFPAPDAIEVGKVAWQESLPGPAELSVCPDRELARELARKEKAAGEIPDWPVQSTLVTVQEVPGGDAVIGLDAADGSERWRYTVHAEGDLRLGQVGVSERCDVLVVVDPDVVVSLDSVTGEVQGMTTLPTGDRHVPRREWRSTSYMPWRLIPATGPTASDVAEAPRRLPGREAPRLLSLGSSHSRVLWAGALNEVAYLSGQTGLAAVYRSDAGLAGRSARSPRLLPSECDYLVDYSPRQRWPYLLQYGCTEPRVFQLEQPSQLPEGGSPLPLVHRAVPSLGCEGAPHEEYELPIFSALWNENDAWLVGECRKDTGRPEGEENKRAPGRQLIKLVVNGSGTGQPADPGIALPAGAEVLFPHNALWGPDVLYLEDGELRAMFGRSKSDPDGERLRYAAPDGEALADVAFLRTGARTERAIGVTAPGTVVTFEYEQSATREYTYTHTVTHTGRTDLARGACDGTRDLLVDPVHESVLLLCRTDTGTEVTALAAGSGYQPAP
ncbi:hypothetical protein [Streptomyces sp. JJ38]|uniref:hypothetical protein n=1 Tax=Streptomyces sp. JJ38 TaxID=2738128 RepID=UPI001C55F656|nr:hypothetical protein [Streptomyces sp. JJ38]MBW1596302.1 hypothetical protein [Streptomyces sp. JJ38]